MGPFSPGKMVIQEGHGTFGYSSGQLGMCWETKKLIADEAAPQADQAIKNLQALAEENGFKLEDAVKTLVFLTDMADQAAVNEVYARHFEAGKPARSCVAVHQLPAGAKFEIEAVFFKA